MRHNGDMTSSEQSKRPSRVGRLFGLAALAVAGVVLGTYAANMIRKDRTRENLWGQLPADTQIPEGLASGDNLDDADLEEAVTTAAVTHDVAGHDIEEQSEPAVGVALEARTVEELYELAKQHDIVGRSNMRKAELIESLRAAGVSEISGQ